MIQAIKNLNLLQKKVNITKTILLNLKQKALNQAFVIILMCLFWLQEIQQ